MVKLVRHETCLQHFSRLLGQGWKILSINEKEAKMLSPDGRVETVDLLHDTVTYYWNSYDNNVQWTNPGNMVDGDINTDAVATDLTMFESSIDLDATTAPGTDLGTITKREWRFYGLTTNAELYATLQGSPISGSPITVSPEGWSNYYDVTALSFLEWSDLPTVLNYIRATATGGGPSVQISRVELRITYTPPAVGKSPLICDVGRHPRLRTIFHKRLRL